MVTDTISFLLSVASLIFTLIIYKSQSESEINRLYWCLQQNQLWNLKNVFEQYKKIIDTKDITVLADTVNKMLNFMLDAGELIEKQSRIIKMYHPIMNRLVSETNKLDHVLWLHIKAECDALVDDRITRGVHTNDIYKDTEELRKRVINLYFRLYGYNKSGGYTSYSTPENEKDAIDSTCTYDENYDSHYKPEKAPNKVTGTTDEKEKKKEAYKVTIVKTYRVKKTNLDGDVKYIDKGTFVRKYNPARIRIENEPKTNVQYHVIGYQTTDKVKKDIDALKWKSIMEDKEQVGNVTKHATVKPNNDAVVTTVTLHKKVEKQKNKKTGKTETIKQKHDETVLYVLLQKEEKEKPISGDYTLKQSQISKRVDLYKTEKDKNILKGHSFVWDSSALNDACSGHTYYCGSEYCGGHTYYCSWSLADTSLSLAIMNARYRADEYKYNIAYKAWDDEWEDKEVANQC